MPGEKLVSIMNKVRNEDKSDTTDMMFGTVTSTSPLKIKVDNRFEVDEDFLILSKLCKPFSITLPAHVHTVPAGTTGSTSSHTHSIPQVNTQGALTEISIWRGLQVGDVVRLLRVNKGQTFYVLEREEE